MADAYKITLDPHRLRYRVTFSTEIIRNPKLRGIHIMPGMDYYKIGDEIVPVRLIGEAARLSLDHNSLIEAVALRGSFLPLDYFDRSPHWIIRDGLAGGWYDFFPEAAWHDHETMSFIVVGGCRDLPEADRPANTNVLNVRRRIDLSRNSS